MGYIEKITMPLLSTLAALVIIVHTAEENYDHDYRVLRPRSMDIAPPDYEQSWRVVDVEPVITTTQRIREGWDDENPDQPMRRRRRKRKRRPQPSGSDEQQQQAVQEKYVIQDDHYSNQQDNIEMPGRRRKKPDFKISREPYRSGQWIENEPEKPLRRRSHRRKRPVVENSWPELNEFNGYQHDRPNDPIEYNNGRTEIDFENQDNHKGIDIEPELHYDDQNEPHLNERKPQIITNNDKTDPEVVSSINRSLSEFSLETLKTEQNSDMLEPEVEDKIKDKTRVTNNDDKSQENNSLDPISLKTLLKNSNGRSLSEILQQNNLSLSDLLHGKERALSILKMKSLSEMKDAKQNKIQNMLTRPVEIDQAALNDNIDNRSDKINQQNSDTEYVADCTTLENDPSSNQDSISESTESIKKEESRNSGIIENTTKGYLRRRFPLGIRRRLRTRPEANSTYKGQINRDLITLSSMKYKNSRNFNKSREWKDIIPAMIKQPPSTESNIVYRGDTVKITTTSELEETTTEETLETTTDYSSLSMNTETIYNQNVDKTESLNDTDINVTTSYETSEPMVTTNKHAEVHIVEKPKINPILRPIIDSSESRRAIYNNRMKRKRQKQKNVSPEEHENKDMFGTAHFVSASQFVEKAQTRTTNGESENDFTTLEDFITTESSQNTHTTQIKSTKNYVKSKKTTSTTERTPITTEETAKYEIEEILNDSLTRARLAKILKERNMTLSELVEHRERGSSHVHLADIFHNASREPNPPEPFLSKSLIEPISREIYPLRALLEANLHDPKTTTIDTISVETDNLNIPVIMDFGNNVNENGENMGIISLFNNFSKNNNDIQDQNENDNNKKIGNERSNDDNELEKRQSSRESRTLSLEKDFMTWNDLITLMQKNQPKGNAETEKIKTDNSPTFETLKNIKLEDVDGDGLIVLEDLQNLKNFDSRPSSDELLEMKIYEDNDIEAPKVPDSSLNMTTKSVTIATASIIGLGLILFLLTYAALKWKQQSKIYHNKHAKEDSCVPTPIFENRKGLKNSSTRSKSPMLSSNIYTIDSMDTHAGNESPEYMWDTLRKPFQ